MHEGRSARVPFVVTLIALAQIALAQIALAPITGTRVAQAQSSRLDPNLALAISERAIGRKVADHSLIDSTGAPFSLNSYRGKALVISLVYSACSSVCPPTTQQLAAAVDQARRVIEPDRFEVLTIGFDARNDTPVRMANFASTQGIRMSNWRFASASSETLQELLREVGFSYAVVAGGFDHVAQTTIIDGDGRIIRQVYGDDFPIQMFIEPLKDAVYGTSFSLSIRGIVDRVKFLCTTYDPGAGRYRIDYGLTFGSVIAAFSLIIFGGLILREWRRTVNS